jgi:tetratricopeptide (TPR) repeat protein
MAYSMAQVALAEEENPERAVQVLDEALQDPVMPGWLYCERAELKLQIGDRPGAVLDFTTCQSHDDIGEYWQLRSRTAVMEMEGMAAMEGGNMQLAVERFTAWSELEPEAPWPHCYLGEAYGELEETLQAIAAFERCASISDDPEARRWAGTSLATLEAYQAIDVEDWDRALRAFNEAMELSPDGAWLYCERSEAFRQLGAIDEARSDIQMCLELSGEDADVRSWAEGLLEELETNTP